MLNNLLFKIDGSLVGDSALYALLGFLITFAGIVLLILVVWVVGLIMSRNKGEKKAKKEKAKKDDSVSDALAAEGNSVAVQKQGAVNDNELDDETVAVITAAIMAYYQKNNPKCEFTVKRIKRI